jgi:hypothetical protein
LVDSETLAACSETVERVQGKKLPLTAAGVHGLREEYTRTIEPARALAAETLKLERTLSDLVNQAYALTPAEIDLMWKSAPHRLARARLSKSSVGCLGPVPRAAETPSRCHP